MDPKIMHAHNALNSMLQFYATSLQESVERELELAKELEAAKRKIAGLEKALEIKSAA